MTAVATGISSLRAPRWMVTTLVGSLALNLIVIGATASAIWRQHFDPPPLSGRVPPKVVAYAGTLLAERVKELERLTEEEWQRVLPLRRALLKARAGSLKALAAEPFDRQRYLAAQAEVLVADQKSREAAFKLDSEIALRLTPEERRGFLRWREKQQPLQNPLDVPEKQVNGAPK
jgi:uncharacterized membrane protein